MVEYTITKGGQTAYFLRRFIHLSIILIPFLYYFFLIPKFPLVNLKIIIIFMLFSLILFDIVRIRLGLLFFGQRQYEATHISAFTWTMITIGLVLLFSPSPAYSFAIISSCAIADPLMGEMRAYDFRNWQIIVSGILVVLGVWLCVAFYDHHVSHVWAFVMAPVTVALEWLSLEWIDDNALMIGIPLLIILGVGA